MGFWLEMDFSLAEGNSRELGYTKLYYKKTT
jgi:hypothetical protein